MADINIEAKVIMGIGQLKQDMITAKEVIADVGIDTTSPIAPMFMQLVLSEIRQIRYAATAPAFPFTITPVKIEEKRKGGEK